MSLARTPGEIADRLRAWAGVLAEFDRQIGAFCALTGAPSDSPMLDAIHRMEAAYSSAVAEQVGDDAGWLAWFRWECEMGRKPLSACRTADGRFLVVSTVDELAMMLANEGG